MHFLSPNEKKLQNDFSWYPLLMTERLLDVCPGPVLVSHQHAWSTWGTCVKADPGLGGLGGATDYAFLTSSQVMQMLLVCKPLFEQPGHTSLWLEGGVILRAELLDHWWMPAPSVGLCKYMNLWILLSVCSVRISGVMARACIFWKVSMSASDHHILSTAAWAVLCAEHK